MAKLEEPNPSGFDIEALAPVGTYVATCLDIDDQFSVDRPKFENPQDIEKLDVTRFLFGFRGQDGQLYKVQSFEFRISGSPKSNLFKFLTSWMGRAPAYGWDYCELKGQGAMITVAHKISRDGTKTYANLIGIVPVIDQLRAQIIPPQAFGPQQPSAVSAHPTTTPTHPTPVTPQHSPVPAYPTQPPNNIATQHSPVPTQPSTATPPDWNPHTTIPEDDTPPF